MTTANQHCTFRELVLAYHAHERALNEFAQAVGVPLTAINRAQLREYCADLDPRKVDLDATATVIHYLKD